MMNKKIGIGVIVILLVLLGGFWLVRGQKNDSDSSESTTGVIAEENADVSQESETKIQAETDTTKEKNDSDTEAQSNGANETSSGSQAEEGTTSNSDSSDEVAFTGIELPYEIENTGLVIKKIGSYDGAFVEDGSDKTVKNVLTMTIENTSDQVVQYSDLSFLTSKGKKAEFKISMIPAGGEVIAFEQNKMKYKKSTDYQFEDQITAFLEPDQVTLLEDQVTIMGTGKNKLTVSNITDADIKVLRVFYKYQYEDGT
ncbi:MAG: hypothetical protein Q4B70_11520 [Lachnospiraceae bacterium]|nr:hypothetical protein [Lachnospiraceae bacterium]